MKLTYKEKIIASLDEIILAVNDPIAVCIKYDIKPVDKDDARPYAAGVARGCAKEIKEYLLASFENEIINAANDRFDAERNELANLAFGAEGN